MARKRRRKARRRYRKNPFGIPMWLLIGGGVAAWWLLRKKKAPVTALVPTNGNGYTLKRDSAGAPICYSPAGAQTALLNCKHLLTEADQRYLDMEPTESVGCGGSIGCGGLGSLG
jgi:hypothetical protein